MGELGSRLASMPRRRLGLLVGIVLTGIAVLVITVVLAAGDASGSTVRLPEVPAVAAPTADATPVLVDVAGAVRRPGLVALPAGSRVIDAIAAAGGTTARAAGGAVNLAARVVDGQQIVVPSATSTRAGGTAPTGSGTPATISLGSATAEQLETLPRIGPALAARILAYRQAHGAFASVDDLSKVGGIGPKTLAGLRDLVTP